VQAGVALDVLIFALPIYYVWKLVTSFRREGIPRWPPILALTLWLLQWPFAIVSAVGCLGGGCAGDPVRNGLELLGILPYRPTKNYCNSKTERKPGRERHERALNGVIRLLAKAAVDNYIAEQSRAKAQPDTRDL
jgi:hypothetical protein